MKRVGRILLLSGLTMITVGTIGIMNMTYETLPKSNVSSHVQAYNHNPNNILDNVFEKDGKTILPFIFKDSDQTITKTYVVEQFRKAGLTIQNLSNLKDIIVTGDQIKTATTTYTVWIYGDVNGDGYVDVVDAQKALRHEIYGENHELTGDYAVVANVYNKDNIVDVVDAQRILKFFVGLETKLVFKEPLSTIEQNIECPKITLKGDDPQTIRLEDPYVELGATVTDNKDKNLVATIDSSEVDTNKIGTYYVSYKAVDSDENEREVRRTVNVVDYATDLYVDTKPTKQNYRYGEDLELAGIKVIAKMKSSGDTLITLSDSQYEISGYDKNKIGPQTITLSYAGRTTTFTVEVHDYQTGIEVTFPKTEYKYQEELDLNEATARTLMASGAKGEWTPITKNMITGYDKEETIEQTIFITYADMTEKVTVIVRDYANSIQITKWPTRQHHQKYGQELDLTGMVVEVNMAKAGPKVLTQAEYEVTNYNKTELGQQVVNISYAEKETTLPITVENYVTDIEIQVASWAKTKYVEDEILDFRGVTVKKVMALLEEGKDTTISENDPNLMISPRGSARFGCTKIEMVYTTQDTIDGTTKQFETSYDISVLMHLANIRVKPQITDGYAHETFTFGNLLSGEQEEILTKDKLKVYIADKDGNDVTSYVTTELQDLEVDENNEVKVNFIFDTVGEYKVIFYVGANVGASTIKSPEQTIRIQYNPIVVDAKIVTNNNLITVRKEKSKEFDVRFTNIHGDILTDVASSTVEFVGSNANIAFTKISGGHPVLTADEAVEKIRITGQERGSTLIRITVNKGTQDEKTFTLSTQVNIDPEAKNLVDLGNVGNTVILYQEPQFVNINNEMVAMENVLTYNNTIYTLIKISIVDEDREHVTLKGSDLTWGTATKTGKLGITYTGYNANNPLIIVDLFADNKPGSEPVTSEEEAQYIGIALSNGTGDAELRDRNLKITYYNPLAETPDLKMQVEPLRIKDLHIDKENEDNITKRPTGYNYEEFTVGIITSGPKQKDVTVQDFYTGSILNYTVTDENGNDITNQLEADGKTKTVEVKFRNDQFDRGVELRAVARQSGVYTINCWITVMGNRIPLEQKIETKENSEVVAIHIADESEITIGARSVRAIEFVNTHGEIIDVNYEDIDAINSNAHVQLLNAASTIGGKITQIELYTDSMDDLTFTLTINGETIQGPTFKVKQNQTISIDVTGLDKNADGEYIIRLYKQDPGLTNVVPIAGSPYTLIPIHINNNGTPKKILGNEVADVGLGMERPLMVSYEGYATSPLQIKSQMFDASKDPISTGDADDGEYLGIAFFLGNETTMNGKIITLTYPGAEPVNIRIIGSNS